MAPADPATAPAKVAAARRRTLAVLALYGLGMSACRNLVYTKQHDMEKSLGLTDAQVTHTLSVGYVVYALGKLLCVELPPLSL